VTGGQKGTKLARFDLIPQGPLIQLAEHFGVGALKYDSHQWRQGYEWSKSIAAKARHDAEFAAGRDYDVCSNDPDGCQHFDNEGNPFVAPREDACFNHTGSHHLAASAWHAFVLLEFSDRFPEFDDRYDPAEDDAKYREHFGLDDVIRHQVPTVIPEEAQPVEDTWQDIYADMFEPFDPAADWRPLNTIDAMADRMYVNGLVPTIAWQDPVEPTLENQAISLENLRAVFNLPFVRFVAGLEGTSDRGEDNYQRYAEDSSVRTLSELPQRVMLGPDLLRKHAPREGRWTLPYPGQAWREPIPTEDWSMPPLDSVGDND
jgi:hypothetical protein